MHKAVATILAIMLAACGGGAVGADTGEPTTASTAAPTTTAVAVEPLLQADLIGGCFMMGPNCSRYVIYTDASIEVYRLGNDVPELLWEATIDESLVADLTEALRSTDLEAMRSHLGPGTCNGCVDGIDTVLTFTHDGAASVFDSTQVELDATEPVFITAALAIQAATATGEIPILRR
jgi:hypothetical protein